VVSAALEARNTAFVLHAIALRSNIPVDAVKRIIKSQSARTVMALSWRAGLSARFGMELQRGLARIAPTKLLNARGGFDYPMSEEEMTAQLALFG